LSGIVSVFYFFPSVFSPLRGTFVDTSSFWLCGKVFPARLLCSSLLVVCVTIFLIYFSLLSSFFQCSTNSLPVRPTATVVSPYYSPYVRRFRVVFCSSPGELLAPPVLLCHRFLSLPNAHFPPPGSTLPPLPSFHAPAPLTLCFLAFRAFFPLQFFTLLIT